METNSIQFPWSTFSAFMHKTFVISRYKEGSQNQRFTRRSSISFITTPLIVVLCSRSKHLTFIWENQTSFMWTDSFGLCYERQHNVELCCWIQRQLVEVNPANKLMMPYILFYMHRCRSLHLWPPVELHCDDRTSGLGPQRRSKWVVSRPPGSWACWGIEVAGAERVKDLEISQTSTLSLTRCEHDQTPGSEVGSFPPGVQDGVGVFRVRSAAGRPGPHAMLGVKHGAVLDQLSFRCSPQLRAGPAGDGQMRTLSHSATDHRRVGIVLQRLSQ